MTERTTTLSVDGPNAVEQAKRLLSGVDPDDAEVTEIEVTITETAPGDDDESDDEFPFPAEKSPEALGPREGPTGDPNQPMRDTLQHIALRSLLHFVRERDTDTADKTALAAYDKCPLEEPQVSNALGSLFRERNLLFREPVPRGTQGGRGYAYGLTDHGRGIAQTMGEYARDEYPDESELT